MAGDPTWICVGSTNPTKVNAVRSLMALRFPEARVTEIAVASGVAAQPTSLAETRRGAYQRALAAQRGSGADWGIGMEGGVDFDDQTAAWLCGVVAVAVADGRRSHALGPMLLLPPAVGRCLREGQELGPVMDRLTGEAHTKARQGAIGVLTGGLILREEAWRMTLACALAPLLHPGLYGDEAPAGGSA